MLLTVLSVFLGYAAWAGQLFPPKNADAHNRCPKGTVLVWEDDSVICGAANILGTTATTTSPQRIDDPTTGLVSLEPASIGVVISGSEKLRVTATGSVGIGTTAPSNLLQITATNEDGIMMVTNSNTSHHDPAIYMYRSRGNVSLPLATRDGDHLGEWWSTGHDGSRYYQSAIILMTGDGNASAGTVPGRIIFGTTKNGEMWSTERMRITNDGKIGIGTTNPQSFMHLYSTQNAYVNLRLESASSSGIFGDPQIEFVSRSSNFSIGANDEDRYLFIADELALNSWGTYGVQRVHIDANGNVGIGTNNPVQRLDVYGSVRALGPACLTSDKRLKDDVKPIEFSGLEKIARLKPVSFIWKKPVDDSMKGEQFGFVAQDVEPILPQIVQTAPNEEKIKSLKYDEFIPVLTKAVQELKERNEALQAVVEKQEKEIQNLKESIK